MLRADQDGSVDGSGHDLTRGLFVNDVRAVSLRQLRFDGAKPSTAGIVRARSTRMVALVPATARNEPAGYVAVLNSSVDQDGLHEELVLRDTSGAARTVHLTLQIATDFADPFTLRSDRRTFDRSDGRSSLRERPDGVELSWRRGHFTAAFTVATDPAPHHVTVGRTSTASLTPSHPDIPTARSEGLGQLDPAGPVTAVLDIDAYLPAHGTTTVRMHVVDGTSPAADTLGPVAAPRVPTGLRSTALDDIDALRMPAPSMENQRIIAAGVPWFLTLFGRDSLLTALLADKDLPDLAEPVLRALAATQATEHDHTRVAEPGKIAHELRTDELATLGEVPYGRYYGSVDATPLFLIALATLADRTLIHELEPAARAAVAWMRGPGGLEDTGYLRYRAHAAGLQNQGWKDSHDAIAYPDARIAQGSIALCEVQGYAWRALTETARLARTFWGDAAWADDLDDAASALRTRFRAQFMSPVHAVPVLALDDDRPVDVVTSNIGHLLFSGILDPTEARTVTERLLAPDMFTGWGVRTLSSEATNYEPTSYHNGSVWPHDTAIAAAGMSAYGFTAEARVLAHGLLDAAAAFGGTLPELFSGIERTFFPTPIAYAHAARPQAWACAAVLAALRIAGEASAGG